MEEFEAYLDKEFDVQIDFDSEHNNVTELRIDLLNEISETPTNTCGAIIQDDIKFEDSSDYSVPPTPSTPTFNLGPTHKISRDKALPGISSEVHKKLVHLSVKDFNREIKEMNLSTNIVSSLKLERKRLKNRAAAVRSREKKDINVEKLEETVKFLQFKNNDNMRLVEELKQRIFKLEEQLKQKK